MHAVEAADDEVVHHVHHRLGHGVGIAPGLEGVDAFLHQHVGDRVTFLGVRHLGSLLAVEFAHLVGVLHRHDRHAVGAGVGLDHHEWLAVDVVLAVFAPDFRQHLVHVAGQAVLAGAMHEVDLAALAEYRVDEPGVDAQLRGKFLCNCAVMGEMPGLKPLVPAERQRRHDRLVDEAFEDRRAASREIVIKEYHAGFEVAHAHLVAAAGQGLEQKSTPRGQVHRPWLGQVRQQ